MRRRHELTETEWARLQPLLPPRQAGKPRQDDRRILNGILWKLATGVPWRDVPARYGPWKTLYKRFTRWQEDGTWARIEASLHADADAAGLLDWHGNADATIVRAHQHAAGARKRG